MKTSKHTKIFAGALIGLGTILLASCTANFCNEEDQAHMAYPYEQGVTVYMSKEDYATLKENDNSGIIASEEAIGVAGPAIEGNDKIYKYVPYTKVSDYSYTLDAAKAKSLLQGTILKSATSSGLKLPSIKYWSELDNYTLQAALFKAENPSIAYTVGSKSSAAFNASITLNDPDATWSLIPYVQENTDGVATDDYKPIALENSILRKYGYLRFSGKDSKFFGFMSDWNQALYASDDPYLGPDQCASEDFFKYYQNQVTAKVNSVRSCIATRNGTFGHYGAGADWRVEITEKNWGYAWTKGFLEGLLVYPVGWAVDSIAYGIDPMLSGMGQILALIIVTIIVRGILLLVSFRSTMDSQKMQALQPELAKLQAKYPNANTNQAEKQRLSQEQLALYKRHTIKPFRQIIVLIFQFPVFICVWSGLQGSAALSTGQVLNLRLSDTIQQTLFNVTGSWYYNTTGWWTALILFLLMAGTQVMAMLLPRIIAKRKTKNVAKLSKNPAQDQNQNTMKMVSIFMMIFTIIMGFMLPAAMGVYWLIGGVISIAQTLITQLIMSKSSKKKGIK